jgi:hypothetical protein
MEKISAEALNAAFLERLGSPEGRTELQEKGVLYIKKILREESFLRKILPPQVVTKMDLQRSAETDTFEKIVDIEPDSFALDVNFLGEPPTEYVEGKRYRIRFQEISSPMFEKNELELAAYEMPLIKVIEQNSIKDIHEREDRHWLRNNRQVMQLTAKSIDDASQTFLTRDLLSEGTKLISNERRRATKILMSSPTWDDISKWVATDVGDTMASKITVDGYDLNQLIGRGLIVTTKTSVLPYGEVWFYTDQAYLGNYFLFGSTQFYIDKIAELIRWKAWEVIGVGIGNVFSMSRVSYGSRAQFIIDNPTSLD